MDRRVKHLTVEGIQKRRSPVKTYVYIMKVLWSDGTMNIIYRKCSDFFVLQTNLKQFIDVSKAIPSLKAKKFSKKCKFGFKDGSCKRMTMLNKFCNEMINAPDSISCSNEVLDFCKPSTDDLTPQKSNCCCSKNKSIVEDQNNRPKQEVQKISGPIVLEQYIAVADYQKQSNNDINLKAGDIVDVIEKNEYGWWLVDCDGILGWAPASFLEPLDDASEVISAQKFAPGEEELYQSMKPHLAEMADELSFDIGVVIRIQEKTLDGWWYGSYNGRSGWVPAMSLKKLDPTQPNGTIGSISSVNTDVKNFITYEEGNRGSKSYSREAPMRRSKVQKSIKRRPKLEDNKLHQKHAEAISEEEEFAARKIGHTGLSKSMFDLTTSSKSDGFEETTRRKSATQLPLNLSSGSLWTPTPSRKSGTAEMSRTVSTLSLPAMLHEQESRFLDEEQYSRHWSKDFQEVTTPTDKDLALNITNTLSSEQIERPIPRSASEINLDTTLYDQDQKLSWDRQLSNSSGYDSASTGSQASLPVSPDINGYDMTDSFHSRRSPSPSLTQQENGENLAGTQKFSAPGNLADTRNKMRSDNPLSLRKLQSKSKMNSTSNRPTSLLISKITNTPKTSVTSKVSSPESLPNSPFEQKRLSLERQLLEGNKDESETYDYNEVFEENQEESLSYEDVNNSELNENKADSDLPIVYQVISSYAADAKGEVNLLKGNTVEVLQQSGSGWWLVRAGENEGWAPSNFLKSISADLSSVGADTKL